MTIFHRANKSPPPPSRRLFFFLFQPHQYRYLRVRPVGFFFFFIRLSEVEGTTSSSITEAYPSINSYSSKITYVYCERVYESFVFLVLR